MPICLATKHVLVQEFSQNEPKWSHELDLEGVKWLAVHSDNSRYEPIKCQRLSKWFQCLVLSVSAVVRFRTLFVIVETFLLSSQWKANGQI